MLEMNDPWYRAHHERKIERRAMQLPDFCLQAWNQYKAAYPSPALDLGTEALFDMVAEATVNAGSRIHQVPVFWCDNFASRGIASRVEKTSLGSLHVTTDDTFPCM